MPNQDHADRNRVVAADGWSGRRSTELLERTPMRHHFIAVLVIVLPAAAVADKYNPPVVVEGVYFYNFENSYITPKGSSECWVVNGDMSAAELSAAGAATHSGTVEVKVKGMLGGPGHFGNLGACTHMFWVARIIHVGKRAQR